MSIKTTYYSFGKFRTCKQTVLSKKIVDRTFVRVIKRKLLTKFQIYTYASFKNNCDAHKLLLPQKVINFNIDYWTIMCIYNCILVFTVKYIITRIIKSKLWIYVFFNSYYYKNARTVGLFCISLKYNKY